MNLTRLYSGHLPSTSTLLYTAPDPMDESYGIVKEVVLCNTSVAAASVQISIGTDALTAAEGIIWDLTIEPTETVVFGFNLALADGDAIRAKATAATAIACRISGVL